MAKTVQTKVIDNLTGEIIEYTDTIVKTGDVDDFILFFLTNNDYFYSLTGLQIKVLSVIWKESTYSSETSGNVVYNSHLLKNAIKTKIPEIKDSTIDNIINILYKNNILFKVGRGIYELNPEYFFKGKLSDRTKVIKRTLEFRLDTKSDFTTQVEQ